MYLAAVVALTSALTASPGWLLFPVDVTRYRELTSPFGMRTLQSARAHHGGIDLAAPAGTVVVAAREGRVEKIGWDKRSGWYVKIAHPLGWSTVYCHLREDPKKRGLRTGLSVGAAQSIGLVGSTGKSSGPHLHFTLVDPRGRRVDPVPHLMTPLETYQLLVRAR